MSILTRWIPAFAGMTTLRTSFRSGTTFLGSSFARRRESILCLAAFVLAAPLGAQKKPLDGFDAYVAQAVRDWKTPGLAIAVVKDDSIVFAKGYGLREMGKPDAVDANTRFAIGSTTKAMTVVALGMLVDEGKVRWDDPVIKYLPAFRLSDPYVTRELTVRDLLTHRTGLGNADLLWTGTDYDAAEIFRRVATLPLAYSMRTRFVYQNIMYALAGEVVQAASGMTWDAFLRTRIFAPLGMTNTETRLRDIAGKPNVASPHAEVDDTLRVVQNRSVDPVAPAGSVWSSVSDMSKWMRFILDSGRVNGKRLLSQSSYREMLTPQTIADPSTYYTLTTIRPHFFTYGFAWFLQDYAGQAIAMHTGSIDGMSAMIGLIPDRKLGVYILANGDHAELRHALMYEVFDRFSGNPSHDWSTTLRKVYDGQRAEAEAAQKAQAARHVTGTHPSLPLGTYAGTYTDPTYGTLVVTARGDTLHARFGSAYDGDLTHWQYETFRARWTDRRSGTGSLVFAPDGAGGVTSVRAFGATFVRAR